MAAYSKPRSIVSILLSALVFFQITAALQHGAHHHAHRSVEAMDAHLEETRSMLEERAGFISITGVSGTVAPRLEIRDLKNNADQWNLFLLGMEKFQSKSHSDPLSYYQVAGVHGRPYITWNNFPTPLVNTAGFCPHAQTLFGSWHRPYLAIYEQAWYQAVQEVIASFPSSQQQRWKNAASSLRMPYWDWAKYPGNGQPAVPTLIRDQTVTVTKASGQVSIANPLYSFKFGDSLPSEMGGGPWSNWPITLRRPVSNPTRSNNNEMNARFGSIRISLRDRLYGLFMSGQSWGYISTEQIGARTAQNGNNPDSIESIHDAVHTTAGGETGGTMYYLDYSAFDPIFWLHHTNVDRILSIYQVLSPDTYVANGDINRPMAQWNQGESKNSNTPLKPFTKNSNGDYFTSNDVKNTRIFGYYYPETAGSPSKSSVSSVINNLYGPNAPSSKKRDSVTGQYQGRPFKQGDYNTLLSVQASKYALDGSYVVHCFLGDEVTNSTTTNSTAPFSNSTAPFPTKNSTTPLTNSTLSGNSSGDYDFTQSPNYVGAFGVAGGSKAQGGNSSVPVIIEGCVPLTTALQGKEAAGLIKSLHPDDCQDFLKKNLQYKIIGPGNVEIPADQVPDLHIYVKSAPITPAASSDELPKCGSYTVLPKVTEDKPAGKPFTYNPGPYDTVTPGPGEPAPSGQPTGTKPTPSGAYSSSPYYPTGTFAWPAGPSSPESEQGYCVSKQTIKYVDPAGNLVSLQSQ